MAATAPLPSTPERGAPERSLTPVPDAPPAVPDDAEQLEAEHTLVRAAIKGIVVGMIVCAAIWTGLVAVALVGRGWNLAPALAMGAGVGLFAGAFYGGWVGTIVGARKLDELERRHR